MLARSQRHVLKGGSHCPTSRKHWLSAKAPTASSLCGIVFDSQGPGSARIAHDGPVPRSTDRSEASKRAEAPGFEYLCPDSMPVSDHWPDAPLDGPTVRPAAAPDPPP